MILRPDMARKVKRGSKTQIRVPVKRIPADDRSGMTVEAACAFHPRRRYSIQPGRHRAICMVEITDVYREALGNLSYEDAVAEGFKTRQEFYDFWLERMVKRDVLASQSKVTVEAAGCRSLEEFWKKNKDRFPLDFAQRVDVLVFEPVYDHVRLLAEELSHPQDDRGYTHSTFDALDSLPGEGQPLEPEAVPEETIGTTKTDTESRKRFERQMGSHLVARKDAARWNRLRDMKRKAQNKGLDTSELDRSVDSAIQQLEQMLSDAA